MQALVWVACSPRRRRAVLAGWGGGGRLVLGPALWVSGQRLVGCGAVGPPSRSLPPLSLPREVARAPLSRCTVWGARVGGPGSAGGGGGGTSFPHVGVVKTSGDSNVSQLLIGDGPAEVLIISFLSTTPGGTICVDG